ncbi:Uncharacterised protein [Edwardsiella hoshinae]|uniref:Uncharacterized protein n=1 Tax=Edwardsiella hoshinae TaxID=93378 RepID=A0A376DNP6_9GAMM|nr:Uncharacterised protein [Edwardsiella hoshinae]
MFLLRQRFARDRTQSALFYVFHGFKLSATCIYSQQNCINEQGAE